MDSFALKKIYTEIRCNKIEKSLLLNENANYENQIKSDDLTQENDEHFLMCKCIALEDMNLDIELQNQQPKTEINNYIYFYHNGIKRTFNKNSKKLLHTIPEFRLE